MKSAKSSRKTAKKVQKKFARTTVDAEEIRQFERLGEEWWNPQGPMKPLHRLNPVRMDYIRQRACAHFDRDIGAMKVLAGLNAADIGCGAGLVAEPLCRMGAQVTGIDAGKDNIVVARAHAKEMGLDITYHVSTVEDMARQRKTYDLVTALEIVEHVADVSLFVQSCCKLVSKSGMIVFSTLNRTPKSWLLGVIAAEHILRWVPVGTHDWKKFLKPSELARELEDNGFQITDITGVVYDPLRQGFKLDPEDLSINYLITAKRI